MSCIFMPRYLVRHFDVLHFQLPPALIVIFSEITEKECVKGEVPPLESENSCCAALHGHHSNS